MDRFLRDKRILIIDDNEVNRGILSEYAKVWGCRHAAVASVDEAMAFLAKAHEKNVKIDLIISDFQMPDKTGGDLLDLLNEADCEYAPVIMLSSVTSDDLRQELLEAGAKQVLNKPVRETELVNNISAVLSDRKVQDMLETVGLDNPDAQTEAAPRVRSSGKRVLVAEDLDANQIYIRHLLEGFGLECVIVPNGRLAVDYWRTAEPDLILMDISMPKMDGYQATKLIR